VRQAKTEVEALRSLLESLENGCGGRFYEVFDARTIRQNRTALAPFEKQLRERLPAEILPAAKLGLGIPIGRKPLVKQQDSQTTYQICWNWPAARFSEQCMLVICRTKPEIGDDPRQIAVQVRQVIDRNRYEEASGVVPLTISPEWRRSYVVVWAMLDLGFDEFFGEPFVLGRIEC